MPIFDYKCDDCEQVDLDVFVKTSAREFVHPEICPHCGGNKYHFIPSRFLGDVVDGHEYNGGRKDYKSRMSINDQVKVLNGQKDPY